MTGTIALTSGELEIEDTLSIVGPGSELLTVDAQQNSRVINFTENEGDLTLFGLTITGGSDLGDISELGGSGIRFNSSSSLTIENSTVTGNKTYRTSARGGGIYSSGNVVLYSSVVSGNETFGESSGGGGVFASGYVTLTNSTVSNNSTLGRLASAGGILATGSILNSSVISGNSTADDDAIGGGIVASRELSLFDSVVDGKTTITRNVTGIAEGVIHVFAPPDVISFSGLRVSNSIIASNVDELGQADDLKQDLGRKLQVNNSIIGATEIDVTGSDNQIGNDYKPYRPPPRPPRR